MPVSHRSRTKITNRLQNAAIDYMPDGSWRLWLHTVDWLYGTTLHMYPDGKVVRCTTYRDNPVEDIVVITPSYKGDKA